MADIVSTQVTLGGPTPDGITSGTNMLLVPRSSMARLGHFPTEVYDLSAESHLVRFLKVLLGDAGAGQLRKRMLISRLQQTLQGVRFYSLDRFYGALFGVRRSPSESLSINPYTDTATSEEWAIQESRDASYRSRITQFARSLTFGATPTGIELVSEALLGVDTDVYESYYQADAGYQTVGEVEALDTQTITETNLVPNPTPGTNTDGWTISSGESAALVTEDSAPTIEATDTTGGGGLAIDVAPVPGSIASWTADDGYIHANDYLLWSVEVKTADATLAAAMSLRVEVAGGATVSVSQVDQPVNVGQWTRLTMVTQITAAPGGSSVRTYVWPDTTSNPAASSFFVRNAMVTIGTAEEYVDSPLDGVDYFDGSVADDAEYTYAWTGTADASPSTKVTSGTPDSSLEDVLISVLEGSELDRLAGDERREFVVRPKRPITAGEAYELGRALRTIKPADARFVIDQTASEPYQQIGIQGLLADSNYWEVIPRIVPVEVTGSPYQVSSATPIEQPRPPFSAYQGEAWSYIGDIIGVAAFASSDLSVASQTMTTIPERVVLPDGTFLDYPARRALMPRRHVLAGRAVSDAVLVAHPYWASSPQTSPDLAPLFTDRIPLDALNLVLSQGPIDPFPQNPIERFWATPRRAMGDTTTEMLEISLSQPRRINYFSVEVAHYPHRLTVQIYQNSQWQTVAEHDVIDSIPAYLPPGLQTNGHPQHSHLGHWQKVSLRLDQPYTASSVRLLLQRIDGIAPLKDATTAVDYSLALRSLDLGYRVASLDDVPAEAADGVEPIGATLDPLGSRMQFHLRSLTADRMFDSDDAIWKSEPQPVNYAVVSLYIDVRTDAGDAQVLDTLYLDPIYSGAHVTVYWTEDVGNPTGVDWYEARSWRPVNRDYRLQKGYLRLPPTAARHLKLEFTALNAEPHGSLLPITRTIRLFPQWLVEAYALAGATSQEGMPQGFSTAISLGDDVRYGDAINALRTSAADSNGYLPTEALYAAGIESAERLASQSWAFGFTPWFQGSAAPRFMLTGSHSYQQIEMQHISQVGFFVGLRDIQVMRTEASADDDSLLYDEHFNDFRQVESIGTWTFNPGHMETVLQTDCVATSKVYLSRHNVWALQFATQQTDPVQIVPDDDLRDPALSSIDWYDNDEGWHSVGDTTVVYSPKNHSARLVRYAQPPLRPSGSVPGLLQDPVHEVFSYRPFVGADASQTAASFGGIESPDLGVSSSGTVYAAVRMTFLSDVTSPHLIQVIDGDTDLPLLTHEITGVQGETIERYYPFPLGGSASVRVRLIQQGVSNDMWEVDRLSLFDPGVKWEFSVDGGDTWVDAGSVRNNDKGIIVFPEPGNFLMWRMSGLRPRVAVSALRIRPYYQGVQNARFNGVQRGPNVSSFDAGIPVSEDPMFTTWSEPVPRDWFLAYRQYPSLVSADGPTRTEFARFYGRPVTDTIADPVDVAARVSTLRRAIGDTTWADPGYAIADQVSRIVSGFRTPVDVVATPSDFASVVIIAASTGEPDHPVVHPL